MQKPLSEVKRQESREKIQNVVALIEELVPLEQKRFSKQRKRKLENALDHLKLHAGKLGILLPDLGLLYMPEKYLQQARYVSEQLCENEISDRQAQYYVTVDLLIVHPASQSVLLIQRKKPPFQGCWALPGGHVEAFWRESLEEAARRELLEETGLELSSSWVLRQLGAFGDPGRDPRGHYISILYGVLAEVPERPAVSAGDDAGDVAWFSLQALPSLAFDHAHMLQYASMLLVQPCTQYAPYMSKPFSKDERALSKLTLDEVLALKALTSKPLTYCLCGSTSRAAHAFQAESLRLTLAGHKVLSIGANTKDSDLGITDAQKIQLDILHLYKIEDADVILILNAGGYIGESTRRELEYAQRLGKQIEFLEVQV